MHRLYTFGLIILASLIFTLAACRGANTTSFPTTSNSDNAPPALYGYEIVNVYPHDPHAYTQGLLYDNGFLYESTGQHGESSLRKVELQTGKVIQRRDIDQIYFAEGLALLQGKLFQLTWQDNKGFIYDLETFAPQGEFTYSGEGWGLTHDGSSLIMSDGSNELRFLDPSTFRVERTIRVYEKENRLSELNELEYVKGEIFANIWQQDRVARIDPESGKLLGMIEMKGLLPDQDRLPNTDVLNGIAYDPSQDRLFVTGKYWPKLFEIKLNKKR
ncbi:MAG TPA: glutaminyl-peptide cyclotransferase [Blastocatellia bacterium]|nr:glutaminyl-peptide cyclotransferase [Blastocatellia bacterium]